MILIKEELKVAYRYLSRNALGIFMIKLGVTKGKYSTKICKLVSCVNWKPGFNIVRVFGWES